MKNDLEIQADVLAEMRWDPKINAPQIGVEVSNGVVTLSGYVESYLEKISAEKAAKRVIGVGAIAQEIKVLLPGSSIRSDTAFHKKELAQQYTSNMLGVTGICNLIEIEPKLTGSVIKKDIQDAFTRQAIDQAQKLDIMINQNIVTIAGKVKSWSERNSAINAAWSIPTVKNVIDRIQIA